MSDQAGQGIGPGDASAPVVVVAHDGPPSLATPKPPPAPRGAPKWETDARERVRASIKKFSKPLADLVGPGRQRGRHPAPGDRLPVRGPRLRQVRPPDHRVRGEGRLRRLRRADRQGADRLHRGETVRDQAHNQAPPPSRDVRRQRGRGVADPHQRLELAGVPRDRWAAGGHRPCLRRKPAG